MAMLPPLVIALAPNILSVRHWDRLLGGVLYAVSPRIDWARLLRRSMGVDVLECPKCQGRLRVLAVITERQPVQRILSHLGMATDAPLLARGRDPTDDVDDVEQPVQLQLGLALSAGSRDGRQTCRARGRAGVGGVRLWKGSPRTARPVTVDKGHLGPYSGDM